MVSRLLSMMYSFGRQHQAAYMMILVLLVLLGALLVDVANSLDDDASEYPTTTKKKKKVILAISAANQWVNWTHVESFSMNNEWMIQGVNLEGFGKIMREGGGFQTALDHFESDLIRVINVLQPNAIIVSSKGVTILTNLISKNIWNGPSVLLSPIPNACNHIQGGSWELEWKSTMDILISKLKTIPISIGIGTSFDEQEFIFHMIQETKVCGTNFINMHNTGTVTTPHDADGSSSSSTSDGFFENCKSWIFHSFPGNHGWKGDRKNAPNIAFLINEVLGILPTTTTTTTTTSNNDGTIADDL